MNRSCIDHDPMQLDILDYLAQEGDAKSELIQLRSQQALNDALESKLSETLDCKPLGYGSVLEYIHTPHCGTCGAAVKIESSSPKPGVTLVSSHCPKGCDQGEPAEIRNEWIVT